MNHNYFSIIKIINMNFLKIYATSDIAKLSITSYQYETINTPNK